MPPNWPPPPPGWRPPQGWRPDPSWGPAPDGWEFWVPEETWSYEGGGSSPAVSRGSPRKSWLLYAILAVAVLFGFGMIAFFGALLQGGSSADSSRTAGQSPSSPTAPSPSTSPAQETGPPTSSPSEPATPEEMRAPLAAGTYIGEFVVTEDSNRCGDDPEGPLRSSRRKRGTGLRPLHRGRYAAPGQAQAHRGPPQRIAPGGSQFAQ